jgi:predicted phosphate transport protein (TIGR00153 family)
MFSKIIPREEKFFVHFRKGADILVEGAKEFQIMMNDLSKAEVQAKRIQELEVQADSVTHTIVELLHLTFITPLDREEIYQLISKMDDVMDLMEAASERIFLYKIRQSSSFAVQLAQLCLEACEHIKFIVDQLEDMKDTKIILQKCVEINRIENNADVILRRALAELFEHEQDIKTLIKLKEIYELLESVTDRCEDVANVVEGIVLEHS